MRPNLEEILRKEAALRERCFERIRTATAGSITFKSGKGPGMGGEIKIQGSWGVARFWVDVKRAVSQAAIRPLVSQSKRRGGAADMLLVSEYIGPTSAALLREAKVNFVDVAGNIYLNAPPLFVLQQGFKRETPTHRPSRLWQVAGLKLLSVLLREPGLASGTYRALAELAGISAGAIVPIMEDLARDGFLATAKGNRRLLRPRELLDRWVLGYAGQLFPRQLLTTCRLAQGQTMASLTEDFRRARFADDILLGGEFAAGLATGYLRPTRAAIHMAAADQATWMKRLRLIPDPEGNVDLLQRFGKGDQWGDAPAELQGIKGVNPILLYGELLRQGTDERLRETADILFKKFIAPRFEEAG